MILIYSVRHEGKANKIHKEMFVQYFTEQALLRARLEKRKRMHYNDFAEAVSSIDQLQFLNCEYIQVDIISAVIIWLTFSQHLFQKPKSSLN